MLPFLVYVTKVGGGWLHCANTGCLQYSRVESRKSAVVLFYDLVGASTICGLLLVLTLTLANYKLSLTTL